MTRLLKSSTDNEHYLLPNNSQKATRFCWKQVWPRGTKPKQIFVCMTGTPETTNISSRGKSSSSLITPPPPFTQKYHAALFWPLILLSQSTSQTSSTFILFRLFFFFLMFWSFFLFVFSCRSCCCVCECSGVCGWVCVFLCVFSPAASVDYGSFADRCSTWLELLRLKAHTIRRGSVKTSRRTQSPPTNSPAVTRTCFHTRTHPSMHAAEGQSILNQAPAF